jgi:hypothetical protein
MMARATVANKWLDKATLPCLIWLLSTRYWQPDVWIHECVPGFPDSIFSTVFGDTLPGQLKDVYALSPPPGWADQAPVLSQTSDCQEDESTVSEWAVVTEVFSAEQLGVPVKRPRRYSAGFWLPRCSLRPGVDFKQQFCRRLRLDASIYFAADPAMQGCSAGDDDTLHSMNSSQAVRLESRLCEAFRLGHCDAGFRNWTVPVALVDVTQSESWRKIETQCVPTLLTGSKLYDMVSSQVVGEVSLWLSQGFPHPSAIGVGAASIAQLDFSFPCGLQAIDGAPGASSQQAARPLTKAERLRLAGNAMNLTQVSAWFAFVVGSMDPTRLVSL